LFPSAPLPARWVQLPPVLGGPWSALVSRWSVAGQWLVSRRSTQNMLGGEPRGVVRSGVYPPCCRPDAGWHAQTRSAAGQPGQPGQRVFLFLSPTRDEDSEDFFSWQNSACCFSLPAKPITQKHRPNICEITRKVFWGWDVFTGGELYIFFS
jgi:hypothetical protein